MYMIRAFRVSSLYNPDWMSNRQKITSGFSWNTLTVVLQVVIQLIYTGILARLLLPGDFALMGVVLGIMGFAEIFSQVGIGPALIQRKDVHPQHLSGAFYTAVILGTGFTALFFFLAPWLGNVYNMPELAPIMRVVSTSFIISALGVVPRSLMMKALAFRRFFVAGMVSIVGGNLIIGLTLAWLGYGVWAYVWALFAQNALMTICYWMLHPVRIPFSWKWAYTRELLRYGTGSTLFNALNYAATKADVTLTPIFAGRIPGEDLGEQLRKSGIYERSAYVVSLPITIMGKLSDNVMFSGMASMQDEMARLKKAVLLAIHVLGLIIIPSVIVAICLTPELIHFYLGDQYTEAISILQILLPAIIFRTLSRICDSLLRAKDATFTGSAVKAVYLALMVSGIFLTVPLGMPWVAASITLTTAIHLLMSMMLCSRLVQISLLAQIRVMLPGVVAGIAVAVVSAPLLYVMRNANAGAALVLCAGLIAAGCTAIGTMILAPFLLGSGEMNLVRFLPSKIRNHVLIKRYFHDH